MDRQVTPSKRVTSLTRGPPHSFKKALNFINKFVPFKAFFFLILKLKRVSRATL